jgi:hypothetical protein
MTQEELNITSKREEGWKRREEREQVVRAGS